MIHPRPGRLALAVLLACAAAAEMWTQSRDLPPRSYEGQLQIQRLEDPASGEGMDGIRLMGVWKLTSEDSRFGGYSALVPYPGGRMRAYTDRGSWLDFRTPGTDGAKSEPIFGSIRKVFAKRANDVEGATRDPASGMTWVSLESVNAIWRFGPTQTPIKETHPPQMKDFPENSGAETIARLPDGRFIVLRETGDPLGPMCRTALLFARDPLEDNRAVEFSFVPPAGFDPTDAAVLPDGRVMILLRGLSLAGFPPFASRLVIADPADIRAGQPWPWKPFAKISDFAPRENYEGLAIVPADDGVRLWLVSDSNDAVVIQRSLLVELQWNPQAASGVVHDRRAP